MAAGGLFLRGGLTLGKYGLKGGAWLASARGPYAAQASAYLVPRAARVGAEAAGEFLSILGGSSVRSAKFAYRTMLRPDPQGRTMANLFTGQTFSKPVVLAAELGAIGYMFSAAPNISVRATAPAGSLPHLMASGNPRMVQPFSYTPYDPLMGTRGSMAFALRNLRHG